MTTKQLRLLAAEIIEKRGWCQFTSFDGHGFCLLGALSHASTGQPNPCKAVMRAIRAMKFGDDPVGKWNDAPERTKAEVLARLRDGCEPVKASAESAS